MKTSLIESQRRQYRLASKRVVGGPAATTAIILLLFRVAGREGGPETPQQWLKAARMVAFALGRLGSLLPE